ncbi:MAG: thiamine-phosphate kinase [Sedimentisphaerales bacterium]|nr:thiamine-phosphate kinase [Sedimentisphaerales bacterium]
MSATEDEITGWFADQSRLSPEDFPIGIGDDMAQIRFGGESVFVTTDMLLDGVHFDLEHASLKQIGYKAMAVSLSDCAAMATIPVAAVVSVALPEGFGQEQLKELHSGIVCAGDRFNCSLVGGDITRWKGKSRFAISVAMLSKRAENEPVKRSGAKVDDKICVTGSLGGSGFGKHLEFEPRVREALKISQMVKVNSMIDLSDGLSSDLNRICRQSGLGAVVEAAKIPISDAARQTGNLLERALNDGEDFELLFTLSSSDCKKLFDKWDLPLPISEIGTMNVTGKIQIKMQDGRLYELEAKGYDHLS